MLDLSEKLIFMHIGKTAGCYVKQCIAGAVGSGNMLEFCEYLVGSMYKPEHAELFRSRSVLTGHVYMADWKEFCGEHGYKAKLVTVLRSPMHVVASTLRYYDSFNYPHMRAAREGQHSEYQNLYSLIGKVDFADPGSLDRFLTSLPPIAMPAFDNPQSRYFLAKAWGNPTGCLSPYEAVSLDLRYEMVAAMDRCEFVGLTEKLPETLRILSDLTGLAVPALPVRVNETTSPRKIDLENPWIRRVFEKRIVVDEWLYQHAAAAFQARMDRQLEILAG